MDRKRTNKGKAAPLKPFCERVGAKHIQEKATALEGNTVICERSRVDFDFVVIATGAAQNYFGIKGVENTFSINTLEETKKARRFVEDSYPERIMIMGSGLTGVEAASILAESLDASIYIIEARERVLPLFSPQTSAMVEKALSKKGVNILTSTQVAEVKKECIMFTDGSCLDCDMAIWTAGVKPSPFIQDLDLPKKNGWILVDPNLQAKENVFAIGDAGNTPASKAGSVAHFQADTLEKNIVSYIEKKPLSASFDGHSNCFIETGYEKGILIDFNYTTEPLPGTFPLPVIGPMFLLKESRLNHYGKLFFKWIYWNILLPGRFLPISDKMSMSGKKIDRN